MSQSQKAWTKTYDYQGYDMKQQQQKQWQKRQNRQKPKQTQTNPKTVLSPGPK